MASEDNSIIMVSVDDALIELGASESEYVRVERLVHAASARLEAFCCTIFKKREVTKIMDGPASVVLDLGAPILKVTSVKVDGVALAEVTDFLVLPERGELYRAAGWGAALRSIAVEAELGYDPIPHPAQQACMMLVRTWHQDKGSDLQGETISGYSYTRFPKDTARGDSDVPPDVQALVLPFRRWF